MRIVTTAATRAIEQFATDVSKHGRVGILVDQLVQAASAAAIAQALPFDARHLRHCLAAPKGGLRIRHKGNLSTRSGCTCSQASRHGIVPEAHFGHFSRYFFVHLGSSRAEPWHWPRVG